MTEEQADKMAQVFPAVAEPAAGSEHGTAQAAALCYRKVAGRREVLLVTSRGTGRWILPKGWIADGATPAETALREAYEEAGVRGRLCPKVLGSYSYAKLLDDGRAQPCEVAVFALAVESLAPNFPERAERQRRWVPGRKAAGMVQEPDLRRLLDSFARQEAEG